MATGGEGRVRSEEQADLAKLVRGWRERALLTQEQLADRAGVSVGTVQGMESGRIRHPRSGSLRLLAAGLGLSPAERAELTATARSGFNPATYGEVITLQALDRYTTVQQQLVEPPVADPRPELQQPHRQTLSSDPAPAPGAEPTGASQHVPRQLPAPPQMFTGRAAELVGLAELHDASTVVITAIDGMAGVGKTALAVQAAHQMADRYPDGQLFIDLHGYTSGVAPVEPGEALDRMLRSLGVPAERIPAGLDERAGSYRSRLADQRVMIVLDNAATEAQVTPLLPGGPGCVVLVTSRRRLAGLDHTHTLSLDTLPPVDAVALFRRSVSESRLTGQPPDLVAQLVELCGRLPLAIRIAAARLRSHPAWDLAHLVRRLRDEQHRLVELEAGQRTVTAALDLSYQDLSAGMQRAYRLLGLHPGTDIEPYAAAALLDYTLPETGRLLEQLLEAHLLQEPVPGRYRFHDLTRAHAAHTAARDETGDGGRTALDRLLDYYRHTAAVAMDAAYAYERERRPQVPLAATPIPVLSGPEVALSWLDGELPNLLNAARYAIAHDRPAHLLHLSTILRRHLHTRGHLHDALTLHEQALTIARDAGHQAAELEALTRLGDIHRLQGRHKRATEHYQQAVRLARVSDNRTGELHALVGLGWVRWILGRYELATEHYQQALRLARATGDRPGELDALTGLGHVRLRQGRYGQANDDYQLVLRLARATGDRLAELDALVGLGHVHLRQGRYEQATDHYQQALRLARVAGQRPGELYALAGLGRVHLRQGRYEQATDQYQQVLRLARVAGHRPGELSALAGLGIAQLRQGRYGPATDHLQQLLYLARQGGERHNEFEAWQGLGRLHHVTGHPDAALTHHDRALALADELGQPDDLARAHDGLAHAHHALHQSEQARAHWQHALKILTHLGVDHTDDEEATVATICTHLANLDHRQKTTPNE
jgi:tetratricopeptide (TPR) repeat protein/transcriptional regulator with XRE-family HTH domain